MCSVSGGGCVWPFRVLEVIGKLHREIQQTANILELCVKYNLKLSHWTGRTEKTIFEVIIPAHRIWFYLYRILFHNNSPFCHLKILKTKKVPS